MLSDLEMVRRERPALLALSVTMPFNLERTREIVEAVRREREAGPVRVMMGGRAFGRQGKAA